jgi:hypothetical protein
MFEIVTHIEIGGSPAQVWRALTDFPSYPQWNSSIPSIEGFAAKGQRLKVFFRPYGAIGIKFWVEIAVVLQREFRWTGHLLFSGIFAGEHYFLITPLAPNRVKLVHGERFSGLLSPIVRRLVAKRYEAVILAMNQALKAYVEQTSKAGVAVKL